MAIGKQQETTIMNGSGRNSAWLLLSLWIIAILYILAIDLKGAWTDEGFRFILMSGGETWQQFKDGHVFRGWPEVLKTVGPLPYQPLFYLINNSVVRISHSYSELLLRAINVLWMLFAVQGILRMFRTYSIWTRLFGLMIFALNGYLMMHVLQIREYTMYLAFMIWSACLCLELVEQSWQAPVLAWCGRLIAYGVLAAVLFYTHPYFVFALAAQGVVFLTRKDHRAAFLTRLIAPYAILAVLAAPWLQFLYVHNRHRYTNAGIWDARKPTLSLLRETMAAGFRDLLVYDQGWNNLLLRIFVLSVLLGIIAFAIGVARRRELLDRRALYALLSIIFYAGFQIAYFFQQPLFVWPRYFVAYYGGYVILATCAVGFLDRVQQKTHTRYSTAVMPAVLAFTLVAGLTQVALFLRDPYMDTYMSADCSWRAVSRSMLRYVQPDDWVAYDNSLMAWTLAIQNPPIIANELDYQEMLQGHLPQLKSFWILEPPWNPDVFHKLIDLLEAKGYRQKQSADPGCKCRLHRYELSSGERP